ncbi:MAG: hypothetical protein ACYCO9_11625 [Streptosporangiaceae bacterium]
MEIEEVAHLASDLKGVRLRVNQGTEEWRLNGRLVARNIGAGQLLIRCDFDKRDSLLRSFPGTFSLPKRYLKHMMVVADLTAGDPGAIEEAIEAAWLLQASSSAAEGPAAPASRS